MAKKEQILELLKAYENETEFDGQAINEQKYNALATDLVKLFAIPVVIVPVCEKCKGEQRYKNVFESWLLA